VLAKTGISAHANRDEIEKLVQDEKLKN